MYSPTSSRRCASISVWLPVACTGNRWNAALASRKPAASTELPAGDELAGRLGQPPVLGQLVGGQPPQTMPAAPSSSAIRASKASFDSGTLTWISPISVTTPLPANFS